MKLMAYLFLFVLFCAVAGLILSVFGSNLADVFCIVGLIVVVIIAVAWGVTLAILILKEEGKDNAG